MSTFLKQLTPLEVLLIALWFLVGARGAVQNDTWWHLATGRKILEEGKFQTVDTFSWVLSGKAYWPHHEWLSDVILYLIYITGGFSLLHLLVAVVYAAVALIILAIGKGSPSNYSPTSSRGRQGVLVLLLVIPWIATGAAIRPHVFTMLLVAIAAYLLVSKRFPLLVPLFLVWSQVHGGVCIGGVAVLGAVVASFLIRDNDRYRCAAWVTLSGCAVALNPLGLDIYINPLRSTAITRTLPIQEWMSPLSMNWQGQYLLFLLLLISVMMWRNRKRLREREVVILLGMSLAVLPVMLLHARVVSLGLPLIAALAITLLRETEIRMGARLAYLPYSLAIGIIAFAGASISELRLSPTERPLSEEGIQALQASPQRLFNTYDTGGYLMWFVPDQKVFIDSRQDPYPAKLLQEAIYVQTSGDFEQLFANFGIRTAVVERHFTLHQALRSQDWQITYSGPLFDVLIRP